MELKSRQNTTRSDIGVTAYIAPRFLLTTGLYRTGYSSIQQIGQEQHYIGEERQ